MFKLINITTVICLFCTIANCKNSDVKEDQDHEGSDKKTLLNKADLTGTREFYFLAKKKSKRNVKLSEVINSCGVPDDIKIAKDGRCSLSYSRVDGNGALGIHFYINDVNIDIIGFDRPTYRKK